MSSTVPDELYYSKNHEWAHVDENLVTVGLTEFRLNQMGEILFFDLPEEGRNVRPSEVFFTMESVKLTHDFLSPVTGTVVEVNQSLLDNPSLVNDDSFNEGWIVRIEMDNEKDLSALMRGPEYRALIGAKAQSPNLVDADFRTESEIG